MVMRLELYSFGCSVALIGCVSFEIAFSLNIAVGLPVDAFSAERADGGRGRQSLKGHREKRNGVD